MTFSRGLTLGILAFLAVSCGDNWGKKPHVTTPYVLQVPTGFPQPALPEDNPLTVEGILLGRQLFYDPILSLDSSQSCGSCHNADYGFTDNGLKYSVGVDGSEGDRNSMPLHNLAWHHAFFGTVVPLACASKAYSPSPIPLR